MPLSVEQRRWFELACARIDEGQLATILSALIDVRSATGAEGELARAIVGRLSAAGVESAEQAIDQHQSNAVGWIRGSAHGPSLLLYSPIDTVTSDDPQEDLPWAARTLAPEMRAKAWVADGHVFGLGAQNPKGHAACIIAAAQAIRRAGVPLTGELRLGFGAGGMPTNARDGMRPDSGHGAGCARMLQDLPRPTYALIAKSGWAVSWEEVGLVWYEVRISGTHTYVGSRHLLPYINPIAQAAPIIQGLEEWFPEWAERNRSGLVAPQGVVSFIEAGWERMPAFVPALCRFRVDLRLSPRTTPSQADEAFGNKLRELATHSGAQLEWERLIAISGTTTASDNPIVRVAIEAWEAVEDRAHQPVPGLSGATDANILRSHGVPTARIGLPKASLPAMDFQRGMNTVSIAAMVKLTRHLIYTAIAVCRP
jgi:acetylornithine deacetylase/succinyl-diaminopimelate desuccinylase-like protein